MYSWMAALTPPEGPLVLKKRAVTHMETHDVGRKKEVQVWKSEFLAEELRAPPRPPPIGKTTEHGAISV